MERLNLTRKKFAKKIGKDAAPWRIPAPFETAGIRPGQDPEGNVRGACQGHPFAGDLDRMIHFAKVIIETGFPSAKRSRPRKISARKKQDVSRETKVRKARRWLKSRKNR